MQKLFFAMSALAALSLLAPSSGVAQDYNQIGIYTTPTPTLITADAEWNGAMPGQLTCYLVCTNPFNDNTTQAPIVQLGGYELYITAPAGFQIIAELPPNTFNLRNPPDFYVSGAIDVVDGAALLATLTIGTFSGSEGLLYLEINPQPSLPDVMAITDAGDNFVLVAAYPASGDLLNPIFSINMDGNVVPTEDASWSDVKALYQ